MQIRRYVPVYDSGLNDGDGGWCCGALICGSPYWVDTDTHPTCKNGHEVDEAYISDLADEAS